MAPVVVEPPAAYCVECGEPYPDDECLQCPECREFVTETA